MSTGVPKAVLYYYPTSIWSAAVLLALKEKGYAPEEYDLKIVDLAKGENFDPTFLRLNPKATVPTLVVPLSNTLSEEVDSRYKAVTDSTAIIEMLDKSRSGLSKTHTTSMAAAPTLSPATMAAASVAKSIIELLQSPEASPRSLKYNDARDDASLKALAATKVLAAVQGKVAALKHHIAEAQSGVSQVSEKTKAFWADRLALWGHELAVLEAAAKEQSELSESEKAARLEFLEKGRNAWEVDLPKVLVKLSTDMVGPYALGDQFSIADLPLAAWFTRLAALSGAGAGDDGRTVVDKIESKVGIGAFLARDYAGDGGRRSDKVAKLGVFWDGLKTRGSWQGLYGEGLF